VLYIYGGIYHQVDVQDGSAGPMTADIGRDYSRQTTLAVIRSLVITLINSLVTFLVKSLAAWEAHRTHSGAIRSETLKLTLLYLLNSVVIPILAVDLSDSADDIWCVHLMACLVAQGPRDCRGKMSVGIAARPRKRRDYHSVVLLAVSALNPTQQQRIA
jgi:hypothetical protein